MEDDDAETLMVGKVERDLDVQVARREVRIRMGRERRRIRKVRTWVVIWRGPDMVDGDAVGGRWDARVVA